MTGEQAKAQRHDRYFGSHELQAREEHIKTSSDRGFGIVFAVFFAIVSAVAWYFGSANWLWWLAAAAVMALIAFTFPPILAPFNWVWTRFGLLLALVISPIVLGLVFYLCVMPIGLLLRLFGKDLLNLKWQPEAKSYWIERTPPGPKPETLSNQF